MKIIQLHIRAWTSDLILNEDGNTIYVGVYCYDEGDYMVGYIAKISFNGERLCDYINPDNPNRNSRFESAIMTDRGTFIVTGAEDAEKDCGISIMEFDSNLNLLWYRYYHVTDIYSSIFRNRVIEIGNGEYIGTFMCVYEDDSLGGNNYMFKFNENGDLLKMELDTVIPISTNILSMSSDIVSFGDGKHFMIVGPSVFFIVDRDLRLINIIPRENRPDDLSDGLENNSFSMTVGCKRLSDARLFCSSGHREFERRSKWD